MAVVAFSYGLPSEPPNFIMRCVANGDLVFEIENDGSKARLTLPKEHADNLAAWFVKAEAHRAP
jgi:hypothetical protein